MLQALIEIGMNAAGLMGMMNATGIDGDGDECCSDI